LSDVPRSKLKENVRELHRRTTRWMMIYTVCWMGGVNFAIIWGVIHSEFDEALLRISKAGFFVGYVIFPNIVFSLFPLAYYNSTLYRKRIPGIIRKGVNDLYATKADDDESDSWSLAVSAEIEGLPY